MTGLVHFVVPDAPSGPLARAAVETGLRMGLPFRVSREGAGDLPSDAWVVACGGARLPKGSRGCEIARGEGEAVAFEEGGRTLFGPPSPAGVDVLTGVARLLSFEIERDAPRDALGRVIADTHPLTLRGLLLETVVENAAFALLDRLRRAGLAAMPEPVFGGRRVAVMTHDTDGPRLHDAFQLGRAAIRGLRHSSERRALATGIATLLLRQKDPYWNFDDWRELIEAVGGRSTFYVYPGQVEGVRRHPRDPRYDPRMAPFPDTLRGLCDAGFEIGPHYAIETDSSGQHRAERDRIAAIVGHAPSGGRAHYWRIDWSAPHDAWARMSQAGYGYDASLSPMTLGYRVGTMLPILGGPIDATRPPPDPFLVLPTPVMDAYIEPAQPERKGPEDADALLERAVGGGMVVLNWHVRTLTDVGPWDGFGREIRRLLKQLGEDGDTIFLTAEEAAAAWRERIGKLWQRA